ncbi:hypothetical protein diail_7940 [Diaporthe ilicicola]|nr:hypothetical protein diail_7940 [Diaporthe ilicicola]
MEQSSVLSGALGAILGYLGAEAADTVLFERLLWPERFYNDFQNPSTLLKLSLFFSMGGPVHAAALKTLEKMGKQGLYLGSRRGNLLGTAFFPDTGVQCHPSGKERTKAGDDKETRNALWVDVVRRLNYKSLGRGSRFPKFDEEHSGENERSTRFRTLQAVHHLKLRSVRSKDDRNPSPATARLHVVEENKKSWTLLGIFCSEMISMATAVVAILLDGPGGGWWMAIYMFIPVLAKSLAFIVSVHRETLEALPEEIQTDEGAMDRVESYHLVDQKDQGFYLVITGPKPVVTQFFRHYGHPLRHTESGRWREVMSITIIYAFVLYFPVGLAANLWLSDRLQYLWLSYQLYAVFAMHLLRLIGWQGCGSTQERIARAILGGKAVWLRGRPGTTVSASWQTTYVPSVSAAEDTVRQLMKLVHV